MNDNQMKLLSALHLFIDFCTVNDLEWFVDGGTLLGTVRNNKMIEWDDDIDIMMPREDFDILSKMMHDDPNLISDDLFFQDPITDPDYMNIHARLRIDNTQNMSPRETNLNSHKGFFIDIYPLDFVYDDDRRNKLVTYELRRICKHSDVELNKHFSEKQVKPAEAYKAFHDILREMHYSRDPSHFEFPACFWRYSKYKDMKFDESVFAGTLKMKFEDIEVNVPIGYDTVLKAWYGENYLVPKLEKSFHESIS